jgi:hypothetical protein
MPKRPFIILLACMLSLPVLAQAPPPGPPPGPPVDMDRMALLLDLDSYQKTEVKKLLDARRTEMESRRKQMQESGQRPSCEAMRAERDNADKALIESLRQVLNDLQIAKFKALMQGPRPMGPPPGAPRGDGTRRPD